MVFVQNHHVGHPATRCTAFPVHAKSLMRQSLSPFIRQRSQIPRGHASATFTLTSQRVALNRSLSQLPSKLTALDIRRANWLAPTIAARMVNVRNVAKRTYDELK